MSKFIPRTVVSLTLRNSEGYRIINLGYYPKAMIEEFKRKGRKSGLYRHVIRLCDEFYFNETLTQINTQGRVVAQLECSYTPKQPLPYSPNCFEAFA